MFVIGSAAAAFLFAMFGLFTAGIFAASVRGNGRGGVQLVNPITRIKEAFFPPQHAIMGEPAPLVVPPPPGNNQVPELVMGKMCLPQMPPIPAPVVEKK
jgi:hypothetical protein